MLKATNANNNEAQEVKMQQIWSPGGLQLQSNPWYRRFKEGKGEGGGGSAQERQGDRQGREVVLTEQRIGGERGCGGGGRVEKCG